MAASIASGPGVVIDAIMLALPALALIAAATPRQSDLLFGRTLGSRRRGLIRLAGFALLGCSLYQALRGQDEGRALICWIGVIGIEALCWAFVFSLAARGASRRSDR